MALIAAFTRILAPVRSLLRRSAILGVALALLASITSHTPSLATSDQQQLDQTRRELVAIQKKLVAAKGQAAAIQSQVSALDGQISALNRQIGVQTQEVYQLKANIDTHAAKITQLGAQYGAARQAAEGRARNLYMAGPASSLATLLSASSIGEFIQKTTVWEIAAALDHKIIIKSSRLKDALNVEQRDLEQSRAALVAKEGNLAAQGDLLNSARGQRAAALAAVNQEISAEQKNEQQLEQQSKDLTAALQASSQISHSSPKAQVPGGGQQPGDQGPGGGGPVGTGGLIWPVRGPITSPFGPRWGAFHYGIDIGASTGTPIVAPKDGTVLGISCGSGYGICSIIDHGGGLATLYAHMNGKAVSSGPVRQGQVIGYVGCTGICFGPHLHYEVRIDGTPHNPRQYLG